MPVFAIWHSRDTPQNKKVHLHGQFLTNRAENFFAQFFHGIGTILGSPLDFITKVYF